MLNFTDLLTFFVISEFYLFLAQVNCEERLFKHYAFRSQKIAASTFFENSVNYNDAYCTTLQGNQE